MVNERRQQTFLPSWVEEFDKIAKEVEQNGTATNKKTS